MDFTLIYINGELNRMIKETGITLEENDRLDINYFITVINTATNLITNPKGVENFTEERIREYYLGCAQALVEGRVGLHRLRQEFSKKYNIPYDFISRNGEILVQESNCETCTK